MPTLILPPRYTEDSIRLWRAAGEAGWTTQRLRDWRVDEPVDDDRLAIYGEPLFALAVAEQLDQVLLEAAGFPAAVRPSDESGVISCKVASVLVEFLQSAEAIWDVEAERTTISVKLVENRLETPSGIVMHMRKRARHIFSKLE